MEDKREKFCNDRKGGGGNRDYKAACKQPDSFWTITGKQSIYCLMRLKQKIGERGQGSRTQSSNVAKLLSPPFIPASLCRLVLMGTWLPTSAGRMFTVSQSEELEGEGLENSVSGVRLQNPCSAIYLGKLHNFLSLRFLLRTMG